MRNSPTGALHLGRGTVSAARPIDGVCPAGRPHDDETSHRRTIVRVFRRSPARRVSLFLTAARRAGCELRRSLDAPACVLDGLLEGDFPRIA